MSTDRNTMGAWSGRVDPEPDSPRWHQVIGAFADATATSTPGAVLLGFACDEGVRRTKGRTGAAAAPAAIRKALAGLAWHRSAPAYDAGDVVIDGSVRAMAPRRVRG